MKERSHALRNTLFSSVSIYIEYVLGMLASILVARELEPSHYGTYSLIIWMAGLGVAFTNSGTTTAAIKFIAELRGGSQESVIPAVLAYLRRAQRVFMAGVAVLGGGLMWLFGDQLLPSYDHLLVFLALVFAVAMRAPYMFNVSVAKGFENFRATAVIAGIATPVNIALVLVAWIMHAPVWGFVLVYLLSSLVFYLVSRMQVRRLERAVQGSAPMSPALRRRVFRHMRIVAVTVAVTFLSARETEVMFLNLYDSSAAAGQFKVAFQLASGAALLVPGVFSAVLLPMMSHAIIRGSDYAGRRFVESTTYLTMLAAPLIAFGVIFAQPIIQVLFGASYAAAGAVFAVLLCASCISTIAGGGTSLLVSADRQHYVLMLVLFSGAVKIGLDWWWISVGGLHGAMAANVTAATLSAAAILVLAMRNARTHLDWGRLLRVAVAGLLGALAAWPLHHLLPPWPRLLAGFVVVSLVYALATLVLGCWTRIDLEYMQGLHARVSGGRPRMLGRLLAWAAARSGQGD